MKKMHGKLAAVIFCLAVIVTPVATMFSGGGVINPW